MNLLHNFVPSSPQNLLSLHGFTFLKLLFNTFMQYWWVMEHVMSFYQIVRIYFTFWGVLDTGLTNYTIWRTFTPLSFRLLDLYCAFLFPKTFKYYFKSSWLIKLVKKKNNNNSCGLSNLQTMTCEGGILKRDPNMNTMLYIERQYYGKANLHLIISLLKATLFLSLPEQLYSITCFFCLFHSKN